MDREITKDSILQTLEAHQKQLEAYGVQEIGLFGSYVRNEATINSDIDLLVDIKKERKTFRNFMSLAYYLEGLFNRKVELVTRQSLSPYIGPHILKTVEYVSFAG
ncbi:MAG: putative nucleotidyltransferase [Segetibacter sp.]|nr:putative nucleotidyltransferase [Segetibacter sp.]